MVEQTDDRLLAETLDAAPVGILTSVMVCPACGIENLMGADQCANCGSDLRTSDIPHPGSEFERLLTQVSLREVSARAPFTVPVTTSVAEVLATMRENRTADVLIVDNGRLVGIFTERDAVQRLAAAAVADRPDAARTPIGDVMTADPVVLRADDSVAVAIQKMAVGGFRHIPLVDEGRPIGVISAIDIFRHVLAIVG